MTDREIVGLAVAVGLAALVARPVALAALVCAALVAAVSRHRWLVALALVLVVSDRAHQAVEGVAPVRAGVRAETVTVMSDPRRDPGRWSFEVRAPDGRFLATMPAAIDPPVVGEQLAATGTVSPITTSGWTRSRHLRGRWSIREVTDRRPPGPPLAWANRLRSLISEGAVSLGEHRSLYDGLVLGDDTAQPSELRYRFRAAGLAHLLAVSGQNVAFVLLVAAPLLRRLPLGGRWVLTVAVLGMFALVTRWEPSVLRAVAMATVAATAGWRGRYASGTRRLGVAVIGCLVLDPLLVWSMGFRLSVAACGGLVWWQRRITAVLGGPRIVAAAVGAMVAAQAATTPLLVTMGDRLSVSSLPANLAAVPVAGWVMVWGLSAGVVAGIAGPPLATVVHVPSLVMCRYLETVASWGADPRWPRAGPVELTAVAVGLLWWWFERHHRRGRRPVRSAVAVVVVAALLLGLRSTPAMVDLPGATLARHRGVVVVVHGRPDGARLVGELVEQGVTVIDVLVLTSGGRSAAARAHVIRSLLEVRATLAPEGAVRDAEPLRPGVVRVGGVRVEILQRGPRWSATVSV